MTEFASEYMFVELIEQKPRTDVYALYSKHGMNRLGTVKWYAPWRQYCFFPEELTVWSKSCLDEVNRFVQDLMREWRKRKR